MKISRQDSQEFISGEVAYRVLRDGLGSAMMDRLSQMLEELSPEQVFALMSFKDIPDDVQKVVMSALCYMKEQGGGKHGGE